MATHLGEITLRTTDSSNVFLQEQVYQTSVTDEVEAFVLDDARAIDGFDATGLDVELVTTAPSNHLMPVEIDMGNDLVRVAYTDAGNATTEYDVLVFLLIEEEPR